MLFNDYKKIRSCDIKSLSEQDIAQFLVLDCFDAFPSKTLKPEDVKEEYTLSLDLLLKKYNKYKIFTKFFDMFLSKPFFLKKKRKKFLFQNSNFSNLILETKNIYDVSIITQGLKDRFFAIKNLLGYVQVDDLDQLVYDYLVKNDIRYLYKLLDRIEEKLKKVSPDYIVLRDDGSAIGRAITLVARKLGIITLSIQRGIYDQYLPLFNDLAVDYVLVLGDYFKDLFLQQDARKIEDIYILGYPLDKVQKDKVKNNLNKYALCYLAQDWERYNKNLLSNKSESVDGILKICNKLGIEFIYRPHPWEDRKLMLERLSDIYITPPKEKLLETFEKYDIFVSFSSTALIEAFLNSKVSLQLTNYPINADNFEELGVCNKTFKTINELEVYLEKISKSSNLEQFKTNFNNNYIETRYNPGERFLDIIKEIDIIEKNKNNEEKNCNSPS
jgi:hypothetical protein